MPPSLPKKRRTRQLSFLPLPLKTQEIITKRLRQGEPLTKVAQLPGVSRKHIILFAYRLGWTKAWKKPSTGPVGALSREDIFARFDAGESLVSIARLAGRTLERIRQVIAASGRAPIRVQRKKTEKQRKELVRQKKRAERAARRQAKRQKWRDAFQRAHELWLKGWSMDRIAQDYGLSRGSLGGHIHRGRHEYGLFPRRNASPGTH